MNYMERVKSILSELEYDYIGYDNLHGDNDQGCKIIKDALERQIPKKPKLIEFIGYEFGDYEEEEPDTRMGHCPTCNGRVYEMVAPVNGTTNNHCIFCGQLIDWSDEE